MAATFSLALALVAALSAMCGSALAAECLVNVNSADMPSPQPLLLKVGDARDWSSFVVPDASGNITVAAKEQLLVACPGSRFKLLDAEVLQATCVSGTQFSVNDTIYTLNTLACTQLPKASATLTTITCGNSDHYYTVQVGFTVEAEDYKLYEVCFDTDKLTPLYTKATIIAGIQGFQESFPRSKWSEGGLYESLDMPNQYRTQLDTLVNLLGTVPPNMGKKRLTVGHLAAKADFALGVQQGATFYYANSAPQWYSFNSGNWNQLELSVRDFASENNFDLEVYTGTYQTLKLANKDGNDTEIYLYASTSELKVPVPMFFWKIVYEPKTMKAMVFLGVNNPFYTSSQLGNYKICNDVCDTVSWLRWKPNDQASGLAYCCEYSSFSNVVPHAPKITVKGTFSSSGAEATSALTLVTILCSMWLLVRQYCN